MEKEKLIRSLISKVAIVGVHADQLINVVSKLGVELDLALDGETVELSIDKLQKIIDNMIIVNGDIDKVCEKLLS